LYGILLVLHIFISFSLMIVVLMQSAKGEGLAGAFGGGGISGAVFGGRGAATFLSKATTYLAVSFMVTCILLTFTGGGTGVGTSRISDEAQKALQDARVSPMEMPAEQGQAPVNVQPIMPPSGDE